VVAFKVGTKVVYPSHGIAEIIGRESRVINGKKYRYLVLFIPQHGWGTLGGMRVLLPEDQAEAVGVRSAISGDDAGEVLDLLAVTDARVPSNWSRRFKNHQEKLKSGDVYECAEVVRNLARRKQDASLSAAETSMYAQARHTLVSELAVSWSIDEVEAGQRIDGALGLPADDRAPVWRPLDQLS
jgi:CarD family transcriptional regulator